MRNLFIMPFGGMEAYKHYQDTIARKRTLAEAEQFFTSQDIAKLKKLYHGKDYAVWGARNSSLSSKIYQRMELGDYVIFVSEGKAKLIGEVAFKARSPEMAEYLWRRNANQETWENIYFIYNEKQLDVQMTELNILLGYQESFRPQGFMAVDKEKLERFQRNYGDISDVLTLLDKGGEIKKKDDGVLKQPKITEPKDEETPTTEHTEMQWRLIRLAQAVENDIWLPKNDQGKMYQGNRFKDYVLPEFSPGLDIPPTIENIDVVWKYGRNNITSAFEIEHSTSIYSGILRLSDLIVEAPNSIYPLFIVADKSRKRKVFDQLKRPTFSRYGLKLDKKVSYLDYESVRKLDHEYGGREDSGLTINKIINTAELAS